ncbi:DUF305 domain-containing protein [Edaphosphingomonas haloaromaticamans]|uniref:DUF305 domain-containing protein n=1 Tax=Edaphosphingomonas haloaromaticamans TaxID=653954 RepID=A0A1S1H9J4_9SPHN|nr:DUF305 domain-containing protein [Sphingomonas haloaromaticamans]OHT18849.1 hypothetical protein BHE75_00828 [Sphingomonas haloaromaticamans]
MSDPDPDPTDPTRTIRRSLTRHLVTANPQPPADCADRAFAEAMIAHYEDSIATARLLRETRADALFAWLAEAIIASHERDLDMLRRWLESCDG